MTVQITQRQTPCFRALVKSESSGDPFDASIDLATAEELEAEGIELPPISCTVYKSTNNLAPLVYSTANATPVPGYQDLEIDADAFLDPSAVSVGYNFSYTPPNRSTFAFNDAGAYFVDFLIYPKEGAAIAFRVGVNVE